VDRRRLDCSDPPVLGCAEGCDAAGRNIPGEPAEIDGLPTLTCGRITAFLVTCEVE
jgi:hypothetical protein